MDNLIYVIAVFVFGTIIGSFLNVVVFRMSTNKTLGGRSMCLSCAHALAWYDLIPIVSYITLRGKCRTCLGSISPQYPIVETLTGIIFALLFLKFQPLLFIGAVLPFAVFMLFYSTLASILIVAAVYDLRHMIIPDSCSYSFIGLSMLAPFLPYILGIGRVPGGLDLLAGIIVSLPFAILWFISKGKLMGFGDVKLMFGIGMLLGLSAGAAAIVISFWVGALASIMLLLVRGRLYTMRSAIPFAPFLILSTLLVFLCNINFLSLIRLFQRI